MRMGTKRMVIVFLVLFFVLFLRSDQSPPYRKGSRPLRIAVWGDVRPNCKSGQFDPVTPRVFELLKKLNQERAFDFVFTTGDFVCAWPHEPQLALDQFKVVFRMYPRELRERTIWAFGNHEVSFDQFLSSFLGVSPFGWYETNDLRVVVLPSEQNLWAMQFINKAWLAQALDYKGRLIVLRHEPPLSCGTWHSWIFNQVERAHPNGIFYGHVHTWLGPNSKYEECGRKLHTTANAVIVGNGGAEGWKESVGWAGVTVVELKPDGSSFIQGIDVEGTVRIQTSLPAP